MQEQHILTSHNQYTLQISEVIFKKCRSYNQKIEPISSLKLTSPNMNMLTTEICEVRRTLAGSGGSRHNDEVEHVLIKEG